VTSTIQKETTLCGYGLAYSSCNDGTKIMTTLGHSRQTEPLQTSWSNKQVMYSKLVMWTLQPAV